jgi:hypothetical protein
MTYGYDSIIGNLNNKVGMSYTYAFQVSCVVGGNNVTCSLPHAVSSTSDDRYYGYDCNGNMIFSAWASPWGTYQDMTYNGENRVVEINVSNCCSLISEHSYTYDGLGNRVKSTVNGVTTTFIGNYFEWTGSTSTMVKYYYAGSVCIAMPTHSAREK